MFLFLCGFGVGVVATVAGGIAWLYAAMQGRS